MKARLALLICLWAMASGVQAIPDAARSHADSWRAQGQGEMRWFGLKLYDAELWVSSLNFDPTKVFALKLTYARNFEGNKLASASIDEMQRQGRLEPAQAARWLKALERVFPDVKEGQHITGVFLPGKGAAFYLDGKPTGEIADVELARRFFDIWLDPRTREPSLRAGLLGSKS
ncbi:chalcone isomerase family protein [Viridibacterium curvum]|uniref:Chalcone isomerase family protein n=1 Tax=Viridibacterium curvum TaxID=1101404 RepID=A0ABP9QVS2_9RHOO